MAKSKRTLGFGGLWHDSGDLKLYDADAGGTAQYGGLTFHQVAKEYFLGFRGLQPNPFYNPFMFPTKETFATVEAFLKKEFPKLSFSLRGEVVSPEFYKDAPYVVINSPITGAESEHAPGYIAIGLANSPQLAKESLRDELKTAGVLF